MDFYQHRLICSPGCSSPESLVFSRVCSDEGLTLETSAIHQTSRAKNIPYQLLLTKAYYCLLANAEKSFCSNLGFQKCCAAKVTICHNFTCCRSDRMQYIHTHTHTLILRQNNPFADFRTHLQSGFLSYYSFIRIDKKNCKGEILHRQFYYICHFELQQVFRRF